MNESPPEAPSPTEPEARGPRKRQRHHITVAFTPAGRLHRIPIDPRRFDLSTGDLAVVETDRGLAIARVVQEAHPTGDEKLSRTVRKVVRPAREPDLITHAEGKSREPELLAQVREIAARSRLSMQVLSVDHQAIGGKLSVMFASEQRVDFRNLVRELSQRTGLRIEMRQVGVRDEAKLLGGIGHCGRELCCSTWMCDFAAVSIRMAKDQNLALSPNKISGVCGRLMCCLSYEHCEYAALRKGMPKAGKRVMTTKGPGKVLSIDVLHQRFTFVGDDGVRQMLGRDDVVRDDNGVPVRPPLPGDARRASAQRGGGRREGRTDDGGGGRARSGDKASRRGGRKGRRGRGRSGGAAPRKEPSE